MDVHEEKVLLSANGLGRAAIVKRADDLFCLYVHWRWTLPEQHDFRFENPRYHRWTTDYDPALYFDPTHQIETRPEPGLYDTVEAAEIEARRMLGLNSD